MAQKKRLYSEIEKDITKGVECGDWAKAVT